MDSRRLWRAVLVVGSCASVLSPVAVLASAPADAAAPSTAGAFVALQPQRLLDTRIGVGAPKAPVVANKKVALQVTGHGGVPASHVSAVVLNVTVTAPTQAGVVTVYPDDKTEPGTSNLNFVKGQTVANLVVAPVSTGGVVDLAVTATTQLVADVSGYFIDGTPTVAGAFGPLTPFRLLDTRFGTGAPKAAVPPNGAVALQVVGRGGVPAGGVSAVVLNVTVTAPVNNGVVTVYPDGNTRPGTSNVNYLKGQTVPNLVIAPVGADGKVDIAVTSSAQLVADVSGYYVTGSPAVAGALGALNPARLLDTRFGNGAPKAAVGSNGKVVLQVGGRGGVPLTGVSAVVLNVTVTAPTNGGVVTVYPDGNTEPRTSNLNYVKGQTVANLVVSPVGADGKVVLAVTGSTQLVADVSGFVRSSAIGTASVSTSRYVRNISGGSGDAATMHAEGCVDATNNGATGNHLMLLDIGAQTITSPLSAGNPGVALSATSNPVIRVSDTQLVVAINGYVDGYVSCRTATNTSTIVVGTNNDGDWTGYAATTRGSDWATRVIEPIRMHASGDSGIVIAGGDDIELGFQSTEAQAETWLTSYLGATSATLVENGSADGCPTAFGTLHANCAVSIDGVTKTWSQAQFYRLAHSLASTRIVALPQIYSSAQAAQWSNIDQTSATSTDKIAFLGALTSSAACDQEGGCSSIEAADGFASLWNALAVSGNTATMLTVATDLRSDR